MTARGLSATHSNRLTALREKHAALSARIEQAQKSPSTTDFYLKQLKKRRLQIKEEIEGIRQTKDDERASASG